MKKSEFLSPNSLTEEELKKAEEDIKRYIPRLSLIPDGTYTFETMSPHTKKPAVYPVEYTRNDGTLSTYYAFRLKENDELIPVSSFVKRYINVDGRTVVSPGFYESYDSLLDCVNAIAASSGKFILRHVVGIWADGVSRRKGAKGIVTPIE